MALAVPIATGIGRAELADEMRVAATSGSFRSNLAALRATWGMIDYEGERVVLTPWYRSVRTWSGG